MVQAGVGEVLCFLFRGQAQRIRSPSKATLMLLADTDYLITVLS